jgi:hypothetical protein
VTLSEACTLLVDQTRQLFAARAERDELRLWLRTALRVLIDLQRKNDRLQAAVRRERRLYQDLVETFAVAHDEEETTV